MDPVIERAAAFESARVLLLRFIIGGAAAGAGAGGDIPIGSRERRQPLLLRTELCCTRGSNPVSKRFVDGPTRASSCDAMQHAPVAFCISGEGGCVILLNSCQEVLGTTATPLTPPHVYRRVIVVGY